jgi:hypothetical protein
VIIGENGTGKTQLLKAAYVAHAALADELQGADFAKRLYGIYRPATDSLAKLVSHGSLVGVYAQLDAHFFAGQHLTAKFTSASKNVALPLSLTRTQPRLGAPIFLPTKEVLSLLRGMMSKGADQKTLESIFDTTYLDLCTRLMVKKPIKAEELIESDPRFGAVYEKLVNALDGRFSLTEQGDTVQMSFDPGQYEVQRDRKQHDLNTRMKTTFIPRKGESVSANMAAEGIRKLGIIQLLLQNHQLDPGRSGTLFWDEPETNMNPKLMRLLVEVLLELARNGQQIVLATHDYVLLKWFDLLAEGGKGDHVRFHSLYVDGQSKAIKLASTDNFLGIEPNPIDEAYGYLIDQEIRNDMGELGK